MARFTPAQTHAVSEIQQLVSDWAYELDLANGAGIADLVTEDCFYAVGPGGQQGRDAIAAYYAARLARLSATGEGVPVHRHALHNLRCQFAEDDAAGITFNLTYFSTLGVAKGTKHADPALYADVRMQVRREGDGHWRIARFDSNPAFMRVLD